MRDHMPPVVEQDRCGNCWFRCGERGDCWQHSEPCACDCHTRDWTAVRKDELDMLRALESVCRLSDNLSLDQRIIVALRQLVRVRGGR